MRGHANRYDWAAYYAAAYERERKNNIVLAGKIADAERREADLNDNLNRIYANPFWRATAPFRKLYHGAKGDTRQYKDTDRSPETDACLLRYADELYRRKHPYLEWIQKENNMGYAKTGDGNITTVTGWQAIKIPESDIMILAYDNGVINGAAFDDIKSCFSKNASCKIAYADEDFYWEDLSHRMQPWFKPDYSPDTLLSFNYWGHLIAVKAELLSTVLSGEEVMSREERVKQSVRFYDMCLCLEEAVQRRCRLDGTTLEESICHIDRVLYHRTYEPSDELLRKLQECEEPVERFQMVERELVGELENGRYLTGAGKEYVPVREAALGRRGIKGSFVSGQEPDLYHIVYDTSISGRERCARAQSEDRHIPPHHAVSVVIPSKDHPEVLERCLRSFRERTDYQYYEWIVVDNGSNKENRSKMEALQKKYGFTYIYQEMPFNFSKMCNLGAERASGDLILLMNDDIEIIEHSWLGRMAGQALQPHVGAVGAKLWYADTQNIQHVGITNMQIGPSHKLVTFPDDRDYYYGHNRVTYDMIGVTAACLMVSREKYHEVGGLDETMAVAYNDVDFCFKLIEAGYYNVLRNDAVLYHHESLSRGLDEHDEGKWERLLKEKEKLYAKHPRMEGRDPFYHRALIDNASDYGCNYKFAHEEHLHTVPVEPFKGETIRKLKAKYLQLTVDRAEIQHKIHAKEPDILWIMGWSYVPGSDNACYDRCVLLRRVDGVDSEDGEGYTAVPADWYRRDVEAILPMERNIGLAGFALRVLRKDLSPGTYRVGMLCTNEQGDKLLAWSDVTCEV